MTTLNLSRPLATTIVWVSPAAPLLPVLPRNDSATRHFPATSQVILKSPGDNTESLGKNLISCNGFVTRILQALRYITDFLGKEYRLLREGILTSSGSKSHRGWQALFRGAMRYANFTCKTMFFFEYWSSLSRRTQRSSQYRLPREGILISPGRNTDFLGKEYRLPREGILISPGRNTDFLGKFDLRNSWKTAFLGFGVRFPCMYVCVYCSCCLTGKQ